MFRFLRWIIGLALTLVIALPIVVLLTAVQSEPLVPTRDQAMRSAAVVRVKALAKRYDPRRDSSSGLRNVALSGEDISAFFEALLSSLGKAGVRTALADRQAIVEATLALPYEPGGPYYVNLRLVLAPASGGLDITGLTVGRLPVPAPVARWGAGRIQELLRERMPTYTSIAQNLVATEISPAALVLTYRWEPALVDQIKKEGAALLISPEERERLLAHTEGIASFSRAVPAGRKTQAADLLGAVFTLARDRTKSPREAPAENRAALIALGLFVQGVDIPALLGETDETRYRISPVKLRLAGREDFSQHLLISAGVAAAAGGGLADAVGLNKEIDDSRGGSGFSFTDLAADRAGVRLAESATGSNAVRVQRLLAGAPSEALFLPRISDLPEFLPETELKARFGGVGAPAYEQLIRQIESRISELAIHRPE